MSDYLVFETDRLLLRPTDVGDASFILELLNTPKWLKFVGDRDVHSREEAQTYIENRMLPQLKRLGYSNYTLIRKSDGSPVGICGLYDREGLDGVDIGFALLPRFEGMGYGFESAARMKKAAFEDFGIEELQAITSMENTASQNLLQRLGFRSVGTTQLPEESEDVILFKMNISKT